MFAIEDMRFVWMYAVEGVFWARVGISICTKTHGCLLEAECRVTKRLFVYMYVLYTAWYRVKVGERDEGTSLSKQAIDFQFPTVIAPLVPT